MLNSSTVLAQLGGTPCKSIGSLSAAYMSVYPTATAALVPADIAEACLKSVPIDKDENIALIDELKLYTNWQSESLCRSHSAQTR